VYFAQARVTCLVTNELFLVFCQFYVRNTQVSV
jgi:hypothetical protein